MLKFRAKRQSDHQKSNFHEKKGLLDSRFRVVVKAIFKKPEQKNERHDLIGGLNLIFESKSFPRPLFTGL